MSGLIRLENRSVIEIKGPDATDFLQGILTNDIHQVQEETAIYAGLLMPQGKLLFDFFILKQNDTYLVDADKSETANLVKRLMFYKLRADVEITVLENAFICARIDRAKETAENAIVYADPRFDELGTRIIMLEGNENDCVVDPGKWLAHRVHFGLPEAGLDYTYGNCFPHDIAMDQLNGIGFKKGCYVGQEVVSRMQHRGTARKRPMIVKAKQDLPTAPAKVEAHGSLIGLLGSVSGKCGLAEIRLDRASKALGDDKSFDIGGIAVVLQKPAWADYGVEFVAAEEQDQNS